ncbi:reverse transcriptase domain-containing protein [Citrus sinensis]|uniref:Reverse transcriptase domain-containing protein n=1 Tax=Citrus sinensis TaxID=2711 RepID=A0ACB8NQ70_CITSI|nr:reverse transcriptase domain-containing protein [Citrus sinensis]
MLPMQMNNVRVELNFENCFSVSRNGLGGGLAMLWSSDIDVKIVSYSQHHIDAEICEEGGSNWRCTGVYGHPETAQKRHTWTLMKRLASLSSLPWLCFGDFNEILHLSEKKGGSARDVNMISEFRDAIRECSLADLGCTGRFFTWSNRRYGPNFIEERIDRFLCNKEWGNYFQELAATNLESWTSDHSPIMMEVVKKGVEQICKRQSWRRIHYEDMWSSYDTCKEIVKNEWTSYGGGTNANPVQLFKKSATTSMAHLRIWSKEEFGERKKKLELLRSRADWLKEGDKNTKFFHSKASSRKRKNKIRGIETDQGNWIKDEREVEKEFCDYFEGLFKSSNPSHDQLEAALASLVPKVSDEMNEELQQPFTEDEITTALAQMCPTKAPGPDGLPAVFFQKHWETVRERVITACLHVLNEKGTLAPLNHTYIALIPKVEKPRKVTEYRPISLCNVIYRLVAKTIANRLKHLLNTIISPTQSAFIPNRLITDNVIIGYECLHKIRHSKGKRNGLVALKLDISKAYDRVEWSFVKATMLRLGFSSGWVDLVMRCITTASFSVLINGVAKGLIRPQRGLRQGCPLSPYLFILCAEVFSSLLMQAENQNLIHGVRFGNTITVSHLLFADDSLIFTRATIDDCKHLKAIFDCYSMASGQLFNLDKSSMFFSGKTKADQVAAIKEIFQLKVVSRHEKYLGLPSMVGRNKRNFFDDLKLRVKSKISNWQHKHFSSGGKEVLIKAIAQAIPTYAMSVFKIPLGLCEDVQKIIARFWWGSQDDKRGIHWAKWERISKAKCRGGMGFKEFSCFNHALVAKQGWRILQFPDSLAARVLQARYFKQSDFLQAKLGSNPSYIWKSILWGRTVIQKGSRWRIGSGNKVQVHNSNWIPRPETFRPISSPTIPNEAVVSELIDSNQNWNVIKVFQHFIKEDAELITSIPLPRRPKPDQIMWHYDKQGNYTVKSGYRIAQQIKFQDSPSCSITDPSIWKAIWTCLLPEKIKIFMWRAVRNLLPSAENLWSKKVISDPTCQLCKKTMESISHALVDCKMARKVWKIVSCADKVYTFAEQSMSYVLQGMTEMLNRTDFELLVACFWSIWHARNLFLFEGKKVDPLVSMAKAEAVLDSYKRVKIPSSSHLESKITVKQQRWKPPPQGWIKINVDAATKIEKQVAGLGIVLRDFNGSVVAAAVKPSKFYGDIIFAEAEAVEWGLQVARSITMASIIVETDSQGVSDLLNNKKSNRSEVFWVISEIQELVKVFCNVKVQYTPRHCNSIAHSLARLALGCEESVIYKNPFLKNIWYLFQSSNE